MLHTTIKILAGVWLALLCVSAQALEHKRICTWDPLGQTGPVMSFMHGVVPVAMSWGLALDLEVYPDELKAVEELKSGKCDMIIITAISARNIIQEGGTLDAMGAILTQQMLHKLLKAIAEPGATEMLTVGPYEMAISLPVGAMYAFVNDREKIKSIDDFRYKRVAVINGDVQVKRLATMAGATPVDVSLSTFSRAFHEGKVDIVFMPASAFEAFELHKVPGGKGGVLDVPFFYGMIQGLSIRERFRDDFGQLMRGWMVSQMERAMANVNQAENTIPAWHWIKTSQKVRNDLQDFSKEIRLELMAEHRFSNKALALLWKIRCSDTPNLHECELASR